MINKRSNLAKHQTNLRTKIATAKILINNNSHEMKAKKMLSMRNAQKKMKNTKKASMKMMISILTKELKKPRKDTTLILMSKVKTWMMKRDNQRSHQSIKVRKKGTVTQ